MNDAAHGWASWPDLVLHVLAHVAPPAPIAASIFDPAYVAFADARLGPAHGRALGRDVHDLARALAGHAACARVQAVARLFEDVARAVACAAVGLRELTPAMVDRADLLPELLRWEAASELLRCAALLEAPAYMQLPAPAARGKELDAAVAALEPVAPALRALRVRLFRALGWHGRLWADEIWVGVPEHGRAPVEHVAFQAAHEATLHEVRALASRGAVACSERQLEAVSLVLLAQRAERHGCGAEHERWFQHFDPRTSLLRADALDADSRALFERCSSEQGPARSAG